jgi:hypothetical protein
VERSFSILISKEKLGISDETERVDKGVVLKY